MAAIRFRLPKEIEDPTIARFDVAALPVAICRVVHAPRRQDAAAGRGPVKPLLQQVDGVAGVEVNGGLVREIQVNLDPRRLEALQLPISVVSDALAAANLDLPGGTITAGGKDVVLRTKGEFTSIDEIGNVILRSTAGSTVAARCGRGGGRL